MIPSRIIKNDEDGYVVLEWQVDGDYYEIEINGPFELEWMIKRKGKEAYFYEMEGESNLKRGQEK